MIIKFSKLKPDEIKRNPNKVVKFHEYLEKYNTEYDYCWIKTGEYLIWAYTSLDDPKGDGEELGGASVIEIPLNGLPWFVRTIENKFLKHSSEGGLPAGKLGYAETVDGEELSVSRMMGDPGYRFHNFSRESHSSYEKHQNYPFSDKWLFEQGLFDQLKELAKKIESGEI